MEYLSQERHDQIAAELDNLINVEYPRIRDELSEARAQGDLSENFEYHTARRALLHRKALLLLVTHAVVLHCLRGGAKSTPIVLLAKNPAANSIMSSFYHIVSVALDRVFHVILGVVEVVLWRNRHAQRSCPMWKER